MNSPIFKVKNDIDWTKTGHSKFLTKSIKPVDTKFVSDWDFDTQYADKIVKTPQMGLGGQVIVKSATFPVTTTLDSADPVTFQGIFTFTSRTPATARLQNMVVPDWTIYIGSVSNANLLPGGSGTDASQWQIIGPWNDAGSTEGVNYTKSRLYIRNISAGSQTVIVYVRARLIASRNTAVPSSFS